jgi:protoheme ferro-lyase
MLFAAWTALLAGATLTGLALVGVMGFRERRDLVAGIGGVAAFLLSVAGVVGIAIASPRLEETVVAALLGVAAFLGGFALGGALLAQLAPDPPTPALPDPLPDPLPDLGVVLLADAEPERYEPGAISRELRMLADAGVELPPETTRVFVYASEKARFKAAAGSTARDTVRAVAVRLRDRLAEESGDVHVSVAWSDGRPLLDEAVADLVRQGVRRIVVTELATAETTATEHAMRRLDALRLRPLGVRVAYAPGLWASPLLAEHLADRVMKALEDADPAECGAALLGYGRPEELATLSPDAEERELLFQQRVRALLVERGFDAARVRLGWVEWQEPGVTEVVRHLAALGCERIVVLPATLPVDTVSSLLDIHDAIETARVEKTSEVVLLPAWGEDTVVVEALACGVGEAEAELAAEG